jgi:origin recognition complex subunit 1
MIRINFQPYTTPQLEKIVQTRLQTAKEGLEGKDKDQSIIAPDGIKFAAMKVSSISGDARRVLDICRLAEPNFASDLKLISTILRKLFRRRTVELVQPLRRTAKTDDVREVIKMMQNSPTAAYLRECSLHERIMLAALVKVIKREGVEEVRWGDVSNQPSLLNMM